MLKKFPAAAPHESGFTLIEVMIAMTILSVGLMSIAVAQLTAIKVSSRSKHMQDAMFLAREQMDTLVAIDPTVNNFFSIAQTIDDPAPIQVGNDDNDATRYTRRTQIFPNQPQGNLARVVVTVTWTTGNVPGAQQIQLTSVMRVS
jgi:prepilin-type N-terminal cleavage/methylation domain-containing protein